MQQWVAAMRADRFEDAWLLSEQDLRARDPAMRDDPAKPYHLRWVWDGRPFDGRHVLIRCYHGLGDTIQFARFLPLLGARAASLTVEVQPQLQCLIADMPGIDRIIPFDPAHPLPPAECDIEITELAFALRAAPSAAAVPYLFAQPAAEAAGSVALCYSGSDWDMDRRVPAELFDAVCRNHRCVTLVPEPTALPVRNPQGCSLEVATSASLLAGANLVITVDTMVAHLAGALGKPTWLLLKAEPDWRWAPDRTDSSWYPTMRLYVQPRAGDWTAVVEAVRRDLTLEAVCRGEGLLVQGDQVEPALVAL